MCALACVAMFEYVDVHLCVCRKHAENETRLSRYESVCITDMRGYIAMFVLVCMCLRVSAFVCIYVRVCRCIYVSLSVSVSVSMLISCVSVCQFLSH